MSEVILATASEKQVWSTSYLKEFVRASRFLKYIGKADTSIFVAKYELQEEAGKTINIPLITKIEGDGVGGSEALDGNEAEIGNHNCAITVDWVRQAVRVPKSTSYKTEINLMGAARPMLKNWSAEDLRTDIIYGLMQVCTGGTYGDTTLPYGQITKDAANGGYQVASTFVAGSTFARRKGINYVSAAEADKDTWLAANSDRILFGKTRSNASSLDHSTALATLDSTDDRLTVAQASLAKRMAANATPAIYPFTLDDGREFYVMFCGPRSFRDLKSDTAMVAANRDARAREGNGMDSNPLFQDGDLMYDGILFREVPEIPHLTNAGSGGTTDVEPNFLCGRQAVGIAWGQEPTPRTDTDKDFQFRPGVATEELRGVKKLAFNGKQQGIVTVYSAAPADS